MRRYIAGRVLQAFVSVFGVMVIIFIMGRVIGDPVSQILAGTGTEEDIQKLRHQLGLDRPLYVQFFDYVTGVARGEFGESIRWRQPVRDLVFPRLVNTLQLTVAAMAIAVGMGLPTGILSAMRPRGFVDSFGKLFALLGQSMPTFWVGLMLILVFAVWLGLLPAGGRGGLDRLVMPAFTLGWFTTAAITRLSRSTMLDVLDSDYIKMVRIKGIPEWLVVGKHALRNAAIPVVTMTSLQFIGLLSGTVVTESVFSWPGIGRLSVEAIFARDYPVFQTTVLIASCLFVTTNLIVDVLYGYLDPRIKYR